MKVYNYKAKQAHPVPSVVMSPQGPFPAQLRGWGADGKRPFSEVLADQSSREAHVSAEPEIVYEYEEAYATDGSNFPLGATVQNNFKPTTYVYCSNCMAKVLETETHLHVCEG